MFLAKTVFPKHINFILVSILFLFPLLPNALQSIAIALFSISTALLYRESFNVNRIELTWKPLLICAGWFVILCFTVGYSSEKGKGFDYVIRGLSLVVFPFLFLYFVPKLSDRKKTILVLGYVLAHLFLIFFLYTKIVHGIDSLGYIDQAGHRIMGFSNEGLVAQFSRIVQMPFSLSRFYLDENNISSFFVHKAYLSMGYVWSIFLMTYLIIKGNVAIIVKLILGTLSSLFALMVLYFTSIPNLVALIILLPLFITILLGSAKKRLLFLVSLFLSLITLSQTSFVQEKIIQDDRLVNGISESKRMMMSIIDNGPSDGSNIRFRVWKCAFTVIPRRLFFGYGIGSEPKVLKQCYDELNCTLCSEYAFNAHNQYATFMINGGVIALLAFLIAMVFSLYLAYSNGSWLYLFFLMLFLINLVGESMFVRIHGILFFALFNSIFFAESFKEQMFLQRSKNTDKIRTRKK